jgi:D-alanyl-D-alanine carboxypeptidase (penicillin-binding protein 5/6)
MKKAICVLFAALLMLTPLFGVRAGAVNYNQYIEKFHSDCYILICTDNDQILFSKDINKQTKPASLTKIVTASVILGEIRDLDQTYTIPTEALDELAGTGSSTAGLRVGETYTLHDLLCCLLIASANDAATSLACFMTGSDRQAFVDKMNKLCETLGCENTHFTNVHGLDDEDQYTSALDMTKIMRNAMKYPEFKEITSMSQYTLPQSNMQEERLIRTTNNTLNPTYKDYYNKYIDAGKTGFTNGAGHCLAVHAGNNGYNYIAVALNGIKEDFDEDGYDENGAFYDVRQMLDWAFGNLRLVSIADAAKIVAEVPVRFGKGADYITLCPSGTEASLLPSSVTAGSLLVKAVQDTMPDHVTAPIKKGDVICKGEVYYADDVIATIDLVASTDVKRSVLSFLGTLIVNLFSSSAFKLLVIIILAVLITLIVMRRKGLLQAKKKEYKVVDYNDYFDKKSQK